MLLNDRGEWPLSRERNAPKTAICTHINQPRPTKPVIDLIWARFSELQPSLGGFGRS
jgi:hypothetical protein